MRAPDPVKLQALRDAGHRVEALINDDIVERFFDEVRTRLINEMIAAPATDHDTRQATAFAVKVLDNLRSSLQHIAMNGLRAEEKLSDLLTRKNINV